MRWKKLTHDQRCAVVSMARAWFGVPYVMGGANDDGVDCSNFVTQVFRAAGIPVLPRGDCDTMFLKSPLVLPPDLLPGDLVFFRPQNAREPRVRLATHVGIFTEPMRVMHASARFGQVCEQQIAEICAQDRLEMVLIKEREELRAWVDLYYERTAEERMVVEDW